MKQPREKPLKKLKIVIEYPLETLALLCLTYAVIELGRVFLEQVLGGI